VLPRLGSIPLRELTPDVVNRFRLELEADGVGPASIRKSLVLLQGVLQRACEWGRLASNPVAIVRKPVPPWARTIVPLAPERVEAIRFGLHDGEPWTATAYRNWRRRTYTPAASAAGVERPRPYHLRHSFVPLLIAEGHNVVDVARQAGHSPQVALDTYAHVFEEFDPAERINAADRIRKAREDLRFRAQQPTLFDVA
jgi:hypothetical protein